MSDRPNNSLFKRLSSRPFSRADDEASIKRLRSSSTILLESRLEAYRKKLFALQQLYPQMDLQSHPQTGKVRAFRRNIELIERVLDAREDYPAVARPEAAARVPVVSVEAAAPASIAQRAAARIAFVSPILTSKGWSILDWSQEAQVDYKTASGYLNNKKVSYRSTIKKLAAALGVEPEELEI